MKSIYALVCPVSKQICYIGRSDNPERRFEGHMKDTADTAKTRWLKAIKELGLQPTLLILATVDDEYAAIEEDRWIGFGLSVGWSLKNEVLPNRERMRFPFEMPDLVDPECIQVINRYAVPDYIPLRALSVPKWLTRWPFNRVFPKDPLPTVLQVWYHTVDHTSFHLFYPLADKQDDNHLYGPPVLHLYWREMYRGTQPPIALQVYTKELLEHRKDVIGSNQGADLSKSILWIAGDRLGIDSTHGGQP